MLAITSCWHLQGGGVSRSKLTTQIHHIDKALDAMTKSGVKAILHCGDMFHYARAADKYASAPTIVAALRSVLDAHNLPMFLVEGNHDQNEHPNPSALVLLDKLPGIGCMGRYSSFELPLPGWDQTSFVGVDWCPDRPTELWVLDLARRIVNAKHQKVVVFGHVEMAEVSHGVGTWPKPTWAMLHKIAAGSGKTVCWFFGHVHAPQVVGGAHITGSLIRTRWDEARNDPGWWLLDPSMRAMHVPTNGPRFVNLTLGAEPDHAGKPIVGDTIRCYPSQSPDLQALGYTPDNLEIVFEQTQRAASTTTSNADLKPSMSPAELLKAWLDDLHMEAESTGMHVADFCELIPACVSALNSIIQPDYKGRGVHVDRIREISITGHIEVNTNLSLKPYGWSTFLGPSGAGKTTILESVFATLFGYWPTPGRRDMWSGFSDYAKVSANVTAGGLSYSVARERTTPQSSTVVRVSDPAVWKNTQPTKVQPELNAVIGCPDDWLRTCFLAQAACLDLVEATPADRNIAVQRMVGLEEIEPIAPLIAAQHKTATNRYQELYRLRQTIEQLQKDKEILEETYIRDTQRLEDVKANYADVERRVSELGDRYRMSGTLEELIRCERELQGYADIPDVAALEKAEELARANLDRLEAHVRHEEGLERKVSSGENYKDLLCRVGCADKLLPCPLIDNAKAAYDEGVSAEALLAKCNRVTPDTILKARKAVSDASGRTYQARLKTTTRDSLLTRLERLRSAVPEGSKPLTSTEIEDYNQTVSVLQILNEKIRELIATTSKQQANLQTIIDKLATSEEDVSKYDTAALDAEVWDYIKSAFSRDGIPKTLVSQTLPGIQNNLNKLLSRFPWLRLEIDYPYDNPKSVPAVMASIKGADWIDARILSGGQRALARLLVRLAACMWYAECHGPRVLILDEPTAHVSEEYSAEIAEMLSELVGPNRPFTQGLLATHDETLAYMLGGVVNW